MTDAKPQHTSDAAKAVYYICAIVVIAAVGIGGAVLDPERSIPILSFCTAIIIQFIVIVKDIQAIQKSTNSMKDELVAATSKLAYLEGIVKGKATEKVEEAIRQEEQKIVDTTRDETKVADRKITEADRKITESDRRITEADRADKQ